MSLTVSTGRRRGQESLKNEFSLEGKLGLVNYGNSSFINALIQAVSNIEPLCFLIRELPDDMIRSIGSIEVDEGRRKRIDIVMVLRKVLRELWKDKRVVITPAILLQRLNAMPILADPISNNNIMYTFVYLMETLHEALTQKVRPYFEPSVNLSKTGAVWQLPVSSDNCYQLSPVADVLQGTYLATLACPHCGYEEKTLVPFLSIRVDLVRLSKRYHRTGATFKEGDDDSSVSHGRRSRNNSGSRLPWRLSVFGRVDSQELSRSHKEKQWSKRGSKMLNRAASTMKVMLSQAKGNFESDASSSPVLPKVQSIDNSISGASKKKVVKHVRKRNAVVSPAPIYDSNYCEPGADDLAAVKPGQPHHRYSNSGVIQEVDTHVNSSKGGGENVAKSSGSSAGNPSRLRMVRRLNSARILKRGSSVGSMPVIIMDEATPENTRNEAADKLQHRQQRCRKIIRRTPSCADRADEDSKNDCDMLHVISGDGGVGDKGSSPLARVDAQESITSSVLPPTDVPTLHRNRKRLKRATSVNKRAVGPENAPTSPKLSRHKPAPVPTDNEKTTVPALPPTHTVKSSHRRYKNHTAENVVADEEKKCDDSLSHPWQHLSSAHVPASVVSFPHSGVLGTESVASPEPVCSTEKDGSEGPNHIVDDVDLAAKIARGGILRERRRSSVELEKFGADNNDHLVDDNGEEENTEEETLLTSIIKQTYTISRHFLSKVSFAIGIRGAGTSTTLNDILKGYFATRKKSHSCLRCGCRSEPERKKVLACAPEVFVVYLHRFVNIGFHHSKVNCRVNFPVHGLDLSDHMDVNAGYFQSGWNQSPLYDLAVVVEHNGDSQSENKYVAIAKHMPEDKWFEYDDQVVREVSVQAVKRREAVMLFYVKRKPTNTMVHEQEVGHSVDELQAMLREAVLSRRDAVAKERQHLKYLKRKKIEKAQLMLASTLRSQRRIRALQDWAIVKRMALRRTSMLKDAFTLPLKTRRVLAPNSKWKTVQNSLSRLRALKREDGETGLQNVKDSDESNLFIPDELIDGDQIYISYSWIMKFMCMTNPGPICNDDISCPHGHLKPHIHSCKKIACIPVDKMLVGKVEMYLRERYGFFSDIGDCNDTPLSFRRLIDMVPCKECISQHDNLVSKRRQELALTIIETIKDGHEGDLPENITQEISRDVEHEMKRLERVKARADLARARATGSPNSVRCPQRSGDVANTSTQPSLFRRFSLTFMRVSGSASNSIRGLLSNDQADECTTISRKENGSDMEETSVGVEGPFDRLNTAETGQLGQPQHADTDGQHGDSPDSVPADVRLKTAATAACHSISSKSESPSLRISSSVQKDQKASKVRSDVVAAMNLKDIIPPRPVAEVGYCCIVERRWFEKWKHYVQAGKFEDIEFPVVAPGPISNYRLLCMDSPHRRERTRYLRQHGLDSEKDFVYTPGRHVSELHVLADLNEGRDYVAISPGAWSALFSIYGGGPAILREDISIYSKEFSEST